MTYRLGMIGGGNMGLAIAAGAVSAGVLRPEDLLVAEPNDERRAAMAELGCDVVVDAAQVTDVEQLMLAVKPQSFELVADALGRLTAPTIVISIMAGLSSAAIRGRLGSAARVVRVMPNTPCQLGAGATAVALGEGARAGDDELARAIFSAIGIVVTVQEQQMYAVTAVSGGGPAYVFLLAEMMHRGAVEIGLDEDTARQLVHQTILGAARLLNERDQTPEQLRTAVTSPGGTTAEALRVMFDADWPAEMKQALAAARDRGIELDAE